MRKIAILILILAIAGCARTNIINKEFRPENTVHFSQLEKLETMSLLNTCAIYLDKGDSFPLELSVDTDIIEIAERKIEIVAKQKLFFMLKVPDNLTKEELSWLENLSKEQISNMSEFDKRRFFANFMIYISKDATEWAPISDIKSIRKIFGSKGGSISFGMGMGTKEGLRSFFEVQQVK